MLISKKQISAIGSIGIAAITAVEPAMATTGMGLKAGKSLGDVSNNIKTSLDGVGVLITTICYLGALIFGWIGAMKWKAYGEQPDRTPFKIPMTFWGIAVVLAAFPEFLGTGITTLWGSENVDLVDGS